MTESCEGELLAYRRYAELDQRVGLNLGVLSSLPILLCLSVTMISAAKISAAKNFDCAKSIN